MACQHIFTKCSFKCNNFRVLLYLVQRYTSKSDSRNLQNDVIDVYNEHILEEKSHKWGETLFKKFLLNSKFCYHFNDNQVEKELFICCSNEELISKVVDYVRENDFKSVIIVLEVCREKSYCLPDGLMLYLLKLFAKLGHKVGFDVMLSYYKHVNEIQFTRKSGFQYYQAQLLWNCGNLEKSLAILEGLYENNTMKYDVNGVVYDIISDALIRRGEASLILLTKFTQQLVNIYKNYYPMTILWKHLFTSEWFADQQLAIKILDDSSELVVIIMPLIPFWCAQFMQCHKIDVVHRFCEILLKYNHLEYYSTVIHDLFDYYYRQQNLKGCTAIVKSALDLQIKLKESHQKRFVVLLTTGKKDNSKCSNIKIPKSIEYQINLKF